MQRIVHICCRSRYFVPSSWYNSTSVGCRIEGILLFWFLPESKPPTDVSSRDKTSFGSGTRMLASEQVISACAGRCEHVCRDLTPNWLEAITAMWVQVPQLVLSLTRLCEPLQPQAVFQLQLVEIPILQPSPSMILPRSSV
jgi:hypothetical protein